MQSSLYGKFKYDNHKTRTRKIILSAAKMILKKQISLSSLPSMHRAQLQVGRRQSPIAEMILAVVNSLNN